jgi:hypothetical protein
MAFVLVRGLESVAQPVTGQPEQPEQPEQQPTTNSIKSIDFDEYRSLSGRPQSNRSA